MYHTSEDEERLFKAIEENAKKGREHRKKIEDEKFNNLIKKAENKSGE